MSRPVRSRLDALLISRDGFDLPAESVTCEAIWREADAAAVTIRFSGDGIEVDWLIARDLLAAGLHAPVGLGDVRVWSGFRGVEKVTNLRLSSHEGVAVIQVPAGQVEVFLTATAAVVAVGAEHVEVDGLLARIFAEAS